jgi:tetratricopeptide (TPR) repeat protein
MSNVLGAISLFKKGDPKKLDIFYEIFKKDPKKFMDEISQALDTEKFSFRECSLLAQFFMKQEVYDISVKLYELLISIEERLEKQIEKENDSAKKDKLERYKERMEFSLGRDYNDLCVTYMNMKDIDNAKKMILKAYDEDVKHQKLFQAALMPAYRNLSLILIWEAEEFYKQQNYFPSFLMAWISIELSIRRLWFSLLEKRGYSNNKKEWLGKLDIGVIVENLYLVGELSDEIPLIDTFRGKRNDIIHATGLAPTRGETKKAIEVAYALHSK